MMEEKPGAFLIGNPINIPQVYPVPVLSDLEDLVSWTVPLEATRNYPPGTVCAGPLPESTRFIFSTWGMPLLDEPLLDKLPHLEAVFYGAGTIRYFVTNALWQRGIRVFTAAKANAVPVAEYTLAQIILGLKQAARLRVRTVRDWRDVSEFSDRVQGNSGTPVGLVSYGAIARLVRMKLRMFTHAVYVYDPFLSEKEAGEEEVRLCGLDELFRECPVVSVHTPWLPQTVGLIRGHHLASMKPHGILINTSRGAVINQVELVRVLKDRPDLTAFLDVVYPEPPTPDLESLFTLPNAYITPHIAGSLGLECGRMGRMMVDACRQYLRGETSPYEVREADLDWIA